MCDSLDITVILCTHNPRRDYISQSLDSLRAQTFDRARWEVILIDSKSDQPLNGELDLSGIPFARIIREETPGLTQARLSGIRSARGNLLTFVDDDNVLDPNYLSTSLSIAQSHPNLGVWGGSIIARYEVAPPAWVSAYTECLALRDVPREIWTNLYDHRVAPWGAGLCIRKKVASYYDQLLAADVLRRSLDRSKGSMMSNGDVDLAFSAIDCNLGMGLFPQLTLTHLIPASRLTVAYFLRQTEGNHASGIILANFRDETKRDIPALRRQDYFQLFYQYLRSWPSRRLTWKMMKASFDGRKRGIQIINGL